MDGFEICSRIVYGEVVAVEVYTNRGQSVFASLCIKS
jgi:hypothetical protein